MNKSIIFCLLFILLLKVNSFALQKGDAEVIHWWISGSEGTALKTVIDAFESEGYNWVDTPVETSFHAKSAALSRILDNNPPVMMQWHAGVSLRQLFKEGILRNISNLALDEKWQDILPDALWEYISVDGNVVAVPVTLHGANWLWGNKKILNELNLSPPKSWMDFLEIAPAIKEAGYIPLAVGGQAWQERSLFLTVVLDMGGPEFYEEALVNHNTKALSSPTMIKALDVFLQLKKFTDNESAGRSWADTIKLVIEGKAAFQVMGDWAKGELLQAGLIPEKDFTCTLSPGSNGKYILVSDVFTMARVDDLNRLEMQDKLIEIMMRKGIQQQFSLIKGSIPPRLDVDPAPFDACAQKAMKFAAKPGNTLPGFNMANTGLTASEIMNHIHLFWEEEGSPQSAAQSLAKAVMISESQ